MHVAASGSEQPGFARPTPSFLPQMEWVPFLGLASHKLYVEPHQEGHVHESLRNPTARISFMVPHQWDFHYSIVWNKKIILHFRNEMLESTVPAVILERDLFSERLDNRNLYVAGRRICEFESEASSIYDDEDACSVPDDECRGLLVALPKLRMHLRHATRSRLSVDTEQGMGTHRAVTYGGVQVFKHMFESRRFEAAYQIGEGCWPFGKHPEEKIGWFEALPGQTSWCIG
jgi:hypothetical protein